ncbi:MAG: hypothetical protein ACAI37_06895 [Chthoniobacter sp.]
MRFSSKSIQLARTLLVYALGLHLLLICAAAASPALHEWMHADADHEDHDCAITLFASGACHDAPALILAPTPGLVPLLDEVNTPHLELVSSIRFWGILEHAPPVVW